MSEKYNYYLHLLRTQFCAFTKISVTLLFLEHYQIETTNFQQLTLTVVILWCLAAFQQFGRKCLKSICPVSSRNPSFWTVDKSYMQNHPNLFNAICNSGGLQARRLGKSQIGGGPMTASLAFNTGYSQVVTIVGHHTKVVTFPRPTNCLFLLVKIWSFKESPQFKSPSYHKTHYIFEAGPIRWGSDRHLCVII